MQTSMQARPTPIAASRTINHPLYRRVKALVDDNICNDMVLHGVFDGIRNRGELKNILTKMNFMPDSKYVTQKWVKVTKKHLRAAAIKEAHQMRAYRESELEKMEQTTGERAYALQQKLLEPRLNVMKVIRDKFGEGKEVRADFMGDKSTRAAFFNVVHALKRNGLDFEKREDSDGVMIYKLIGDNVDVDAHIKKQPLTEIIKAKFRAGRTVLVRDYPNTDSLKNAVHRLRKEGLLVDSVKSKGVVTAFRLTKI